MTKNKCKGFTLVECIVAMAILGIASLTIAQVYGAVARMNVNHQFNSASLAEQMKYVERYAEGDTVRTTLPSPHSPPAGAVRQPIATNAPQALVLEPVTNDDGVAPVGLPRPNGVTSNYPPAVYTIGVNTHILFSRNADDTVDDDGDTQRLRFKYMEAVIFDE
ncbi:MAG: prepilin-type N-terminal cleavage/methylation domain-containing protein [Oscillospiraceae bacterium]|nr:prepilin-type N-terminal cleavage/methylation domain-containing protein [Oscillospiraceae bacterium]